ncbi:MAG: hypothetical protein QNK19_10205 [Xanthomonadales bacterium]|nr:hypothetical protein [Xanthomonadales bacterium]
MKKIFVLITILSLMFLSACSTTSGGRRNIEDSVVVDKSLTEIPESQLLNASIEVFDPGALPEDEKEANGLSMDIRKAEARYMPEQLRATMEKTGYWGAVRVVPRGLGNGELLVSGIILESNGLQLDLQVTAKDASGHRWFTREYRAGVEADYYQSSGLSGEVFQPLYNTIANDLATFLKSLTQDDISSVRRVAELRFAADIAPEAYNDYLELNETGEYTVVHVPSNDDPMYGRVQAIQERDLLMIDTLNGHFDNFHREMQQPYTEWRKARSDEAEKQKALEKAALNRTLLGVASIVGAIFVGVAAPEYNSGLDTLTDVMVLGGAAAIKSGMDKRSEAVIHRESIEELGTSFSSEARPLVVEVEGKTVELTGSAEAQYEQWRVLMGQIYASETGLTGSLD